MIKINKKEVSILEFDVDLEGANNSEIKECRLSIQRGSAIISYQGTINNNVARFQIDEFPFEAGEYKLFAEFFVRDFYFRPIEEMIQVKDIFVKVGSMKLEPTIVKPSNVFLDGMTEIKQVKPKVTLKIG